MPIELSEVGSSEAGELVSPEEASVGGEENTDPDFLSRKQLNTEESGHRHSKVTLTSDSEIATLHTTVQEPPTLKKEVGNSQMESEDTLLADRSYSSIELKVET